MVPQVGAVWTDVPGEVDRFLPRSRERDRVSRCCRDRCEGVPPRWGSPMISRPALRRSRSCGRRTMATGWYSNVSWWARLNPKSPGSAARPSSARMTGPTSRCRASGPTSSWWYSSSTTSSRPTPAFTRSRRRTRWARLPPPSILTLVVSFYIPIIILFLISRYFFE